MPVTKTEIDETITKVVPFLKFATKVTCNITNALQNQQHASIILTACHLDPGLSTSPICVLRFWPSHNSQTSCGRSSQRNVFHCCQVTSVTASVHKTQYDAHYILSVLIHDVKKLNHQTPFNDYMLLKHQPRKFLFQTLHLGHMVLTHFSFFALFTVFTHILIYSTNSNSMFAEVLH